jgi:hypothetical protein
MKDKLLDYIAAAENATNPIPESSCGESMHLHEIRIYTEMQPLLIPKALSWIILSRQQKRS